MPTSKPKRNSRNSRNSRKKINMRVHEDDTLQFLEEINEPGGHLENLNYTYLPRHIAGRVNKRYNKNENELLLEEERNRLEMIERELQRERDLQLINERDSLRKALQRLDTSHSYFPMVRGPIRAYHPIQLPPLRIVKPRPDIVPSPPPNIRSQQISLREALQRLR